MCASLCLGPQSLAWGWGGPNDVGQETQCSAGDSPYPSASRAGTCQEPVASEAGLDLEQIQISPVTNRLTLFLEIRNREDAVVLVAPDFEHKQPSSLALHLWGLMLLLHTH